MTNFCLEPQLQADYEMNLVQNESLNKQLVTAKEQLSKSDSRLKEVALKLAQVDENKVTLKKQVDLLSRKLKQKVSDNDQMGVELKSEQTNRVQLDEEVHALQLELRSVKNQLKAESDRNHNLQVKCPKFQFFVIYDVIIIDHLMTFFMTLH